MGNQTTRETQKAMKYFTGLYIYFDTDGNVDDAKAWINKRGYTADQVKLIKCKRYNGVAVIWR